MNRANPVGAGRAKAEQAMDMIGRCAMAALVTLVGLTGAARTEEGAPVNEVLPGHGAVTNLPLPRFVSLKGTEGNARRGPSLNQRIDWVFVRRDMPLEITAEFENWRLVQDKDGAGGWVHYTLLSGSRTVVVEQDMTTIYDAPDEGSRAVARLQANVVGRVSECTQSWCRISVGGEKGWAPKAALWGIGPDEVLD